MVAHGWKSVRFLLRDCLPRPPSGGPPASRLLMVPAYRSLAKLRSSARIPSSAPKALKISEHCDGGRECDPSRFEA
jgi:hypothetical protein